MRALKWMLCAILLLVAGGTLRTDSSDSGRLPMAAAPGTPDGASIMTGASPTAGVPFPTASASREQDAIEKAVTKKIPILMYHSISENPQNRLCVSPATFAKQMEYLKQAGYHTIAFKDLEDWEAGKPLPVKPVLITLDDGYRDNYTEAYPVLKRLNLKATIFMVTGFFNQKQFLTEDMAKEMLASGLVEFGAHTVSHADLTTLADNRLQSEILQSKSQLEAVLGIPVTAFCYPAGRFTEKTVVYVKKAGYRFAITTRPGWAELSQGPYTLHRVRINGDLPLERFKQMFP